MESIFQWILSRSTENTWNDQSTSEQTSKPLHPESEHTDPHGWQSLVSWHEFKIISEEVQLNSDYQDYGKYDSNGHYSSCHLITLDKYEEGMSLLKCLFSFWCVNGSAPRSSSVQITKETSEWSHFPQVRPHLERVFWRLLENEKSNWTSPELDTSI